jgi:hypothetical protein
MLEVQKATIDSAATSRLDEIRASLGSGTGGAAGGAGQQSLSSAETPAIEQNSSDSAENVQVPLTKPQEAQQAQPES